jgi:hypothetical protein
MKNYRQSRGERNILQTIKRSKVNWIGHILCKKKKKKTVPEGKTQGRIEVMGR